MLINDYVDYVDYVDYADYVDYVDYVPRYWKLYINLCDVQLSEPQSDHLTVNIETALVSSQ